MSPSRSDHYFFEQGNQARCRYILWGCEAGLALSHFFADQSSKFYDYVQSQGWSWDATSVRQSLEVSQHQTTQECFTKVDLPHSLLDAYRGLRWIDQGLTNHEKVSQEALAWQDNEAQVFVKELSSIVPEPQKTLSMQILAEFLPGLERPIRLVKQFHDQSEADPWLGNPFFTLDLTSEQLRTLLAGSKERWRRFLQLAEQKVLAQLSKTQPFAHDPEAVLVTSVGSLERLGLTNLYQQCHTLVMYPSQVPDVAYTITLYSYRELLTCVVSGRDVATKAQSLLLLLLQNKWIPLAERLNR